MTAAIEHGSMAPRPAVLDDLFGSLDRDGIRWSLLRPRATLTSPEGDVDVLVQPESLGRVRELLARHGFVEMPVPGPDVHAVVYDAAAGHFAWLHVQSALRLAGAVLPAEAVLAEADADRIPQPSDDWLLWILLLRALVDKGALPERHRAHVRTLAQRWQRGPEQLESLARRHGLDPPPVVAAAAAGDWELLLSHSVWIPPARERWPARVVRAPRRLGRQRRRHGLSVAVIGPDGAGKSTLVEALTRTLPLPTRVQYMGLTGGRLEQADSLRVPGLVLAARLLVLWARYARGAMHRARGEIVLFERYTLDGAVPSGVRLDLGGRISRRVQRWACPMPDLVVLLDASGLTMHARKGEYDAAVLEDWRAAYARLRRSVPALEVIDAEQPADAVRRAAEELVWRRYQELRPVRRPQ